MESRGWFALSKSFLVTGAAGFIGAALVKKLIKNGKNVIGVDNLNDYYDVKLKKARLSEIESISKGNQWLFHKLSIENKDDLSKLFEEARPKVVINLAAQAGVRYSLENPSAYIQSNLVGFGNILESCRICAVENLIYASSSSVYGGNKLLPFSEKQPVNHPISLYAASKKANELMAHTYSHLFNIPATGLRFFTVYGPWGRPDMAPMIFAKAILSGKPIKIFNHGKMQRDFTYIDDIIEAIYRCCLKPATINNDFDALNPDPGTANAPHRIFNLGNSKPIDLMDFILLLESILGQKAIKEFESLQPGDVISTASDNSAIKEWIDFAPKTVLQVGVQNFADWYKSFYA